MAQFTLQWDNTDILANPNNINQRASYRQASVGGAWITAGFTPANDLATSVTSVLSPVLTNNVVYQFIVQSVCTQNGPISNDNGIIEQIGFSCIEPGIEYTDETSTILVNLASTDISKVRFVLRKSSDNSIAYGPITVNRVGNSAQAIATGLTADTSYYWQTTFYATVNGVEVNSSAAEYLNSVCGPYVFTTEEAPVMDLQWIALDTACQKDNNFAVVKTIPGLASPTNTWYDEPNNLVYVADIDAPSGNVYWFNPDTATSAGHMTHSTQVLQTELYNNYIDSVYRKIYFVGANSGGMIVYDIDTDTASLVAFGTNGSFQRTTLFVTEDKIYCNNGATSLIIIDRATLVVDSTVTIASLTNPTHFNSGPFILAYADSKIFVVSNNASIGTVGVYSADFSTHLGEITLPGAATWTFAKYWQSIFYDVTSNLLYVGDTGSSKQFTINPVTQAVVSSRTSVNKETKSNVGMNWLLDPTTGELMATYYGANSSSDVSPIKRMYMENRSDFSTFKNMYEGFYVERTALMVGSSKFIGTDAGQPSFGSDPNWATDGSVTIFSNTLTGGNTGIEITLTLQEVDANDGNNPTGNTKVNDASDPDYIPPATDLTDCPITGTLTCPTDLVTTFSGATLQYEFALLASVVNNPNIAKMEIYVYNVDTASTEGSPVTVVNPSVNYYAGSFGALGGSNYTIQVRYLDNTDTILTTC